MSLGPEALAAAARRIRLLVLDVDGVLTAGKLYFGADGEALKTFDIRDGLGIKLLAEAGIASAIITGRRSPMVARRAADLGIAHVVQGREDKLTALDELRGELQIDYPQIAYIGDDLPDLAAIRKVGLGITVANGDAFVARHADWQTRRSGGDGAVREAAEMILQAQDRLETLQRRYLQEGPTG
ncbi:MAG: HAD hydrolase family protein [Spongiibacteraceae bacterium]|jgi:3-deoxy-D-manno-octulosonate 8-phosphate phosphatase (KDO 8-P phosphatase)|nr:HAD hydrolase family protein [Spongiibacteraceae bacterium]